MSFDSDFNTTSDSRLRSDERFSGRSSMPQTSPAPDHEIEDIINNTGNARPPRRKETPVFGSADAPGDRAGDLAKLKQAWVSERTAPELFPFLHDEVDRIMEKIRNQMEYIEVYSMNLAVAPDTKLKLLIVETDLERTKFVLRGYLRTRLSKVSFATASISNQIANILSLKLRSTRLTNTQYTLSKHLANNENFLTARQTI